MQNGQFNLSQLGMPPQQASLPPGLGMNMQQQGGQGQQGIYQQQQQGGGQQMQGQMGNPGLGLGLNMPGGGGNGGMGMGMGGGGQGQGQVQQAQMQGNVSIPRIFHGGTSLKLNGDLVCVELSRKYPSELQPQSSRPVRSDATKPRSTDQRQHQPPAKHATQPKLPEQDPATDGPSPSSGSEHADDGDEPRSEYGNAGSAGAGWKWRESDDERRAESIARPGSTATTGYEGE